MRIFLIIILFEVSITSIFAQCPCEKSNAEAALPKFDNVVFVELIAKSKNNKRFNKNQPVPKGILNKFEVFGVIKGTFQFGDTITALTGNGKDDNGYIFEIGERYILFYEDYIDKCSPTIGFTPEIYSKLFYKIHSKPDPQPAPPRSYSSQLWKYEANPTFNFIGLKAEVINKDKKEAFILLQQEIHSEGEIQKNSLIQIVLDEQNKVIHSRVIFLEGNRGCSKISGRLRKYMEEHLIFRTVDENCLINQSTWYYRYK